MKTNVLTFLRSLPTLVLFFNGIALQGFAQLDSNNLETRLEVVAFVKGHQHAVNIDLSILKNGFHLQLSDTSFQVESFRMGWFDKEKGNVYAWIQGALVKGRSNDYDLGRAYAKQGNEDPGGRHIFAFDEILVRREDQLYYV